MSCVVRGAVRIVLVLTVMLVTNEVSAQAQDEARTLVTPFSASTKDNNQEAKPWKVAFVGGVLVTSGMAAGWAYKGSQVTGSLSDSTQTQFFATGTAMAALATVYFGYQSWRHDKQHKKLNKHKKRKRQVILAPQLGARSVGAGLSLEF